MNDFFSSYKLAFDNFDAKSIASHYQFPCQILDVDGLQIYASPEQLMAKFSHNFENMKSMGYSDSTFDIVEFKFLGDKIKLVDIHWKVSLSSGVYEFNTLYLCQKEKSNWLIFLMLWFMSNL